MPKLRNASKAKDAVNRYKPLLKTILGEMKGEGIRISDLAQMLNRDRCREGALRARLAQGGNITLEDLYAILETLGIPGGKVRDLIPLPE